MRPPLETAELLAFSKTVEAKSLSRAAVELRVPRATISRRLARLEERLGARLLRRTTRSLALTEAGEALYRHARIVLEAVTTAEASVRRSNDEVRGDLLVSVPPISDPSFFAVLCDFAKKYPAVRLHVNVSSERVDLLRSGYDVALRAGTEFEPGLVARFLARARVIGVASPAYLAERGVPRTRRDLQGHRCIIGLGRGEVGQTHWPFIGSRKVQVEGAFFSNDVTLVLDAALRGLGIALLPSVIVSKRIESGALVHVLPGLLQADSRMAIVYPEREFLPPHVRAFVETIAAWMPADLQESSSGEKVVRGPSRAKRRP